MADEQDMLNRWRLVLGKYAAGQISFSGDEHGSLKLMDMEQVLDYLYSREYGEEQGIREDRGGGSEASQPTIPQWLSKVKKLFPKQTVEIMEHHAEARAKQRIAKNNPGIKAYDEGRSAAACKRSGTEGSGRDYKKARTGYSEILFWTNRPQFEQSRSLDPESGYETDDSDEFEKL